MNRYNTNALIYILKNTTGKGREGKGRGLLGGGLHSQNFLGQGHYEGKEIKGFVNISNVGGLSSPCPPRESKWVQKICNKGFDQSVVLGLCFQKVIY